MVLLFKEVVATLNLETQINNYDRKLVWKTERRACPLPVRGSLLTLQKELTLS